ncbi:hypothetical protein [Thiohalocapsa halophila]|uniref:hypothetical protein n=1 Tax=Thiohalocapsa halophila TaxID=69359 RepID=UPI0019056FBB|nr:hypothetical protein [Thiohalocapsa halophila]
MVAISSPWLVEQRDLQLRGNLLHPIEAAVGAGGHLAVWTLSETAGDRGGLLDPAG